MSTQIEINKKIINYLSKLSYRPDPIVDELIKETKNLGQISEMQIAPEQGQFLELLTKLISAKKCLEIGRFTGLSALNLAKALPEEGRVITIDNSEDLLPIAKKYWRMAKVEKKIESIIGQGVNVLNELISQKIFLTIRLISNK